MDSKMILDFLRQVMANNNRPWFQEHKAEYEAARAEFERGIAQALERIITFDASVANQTVKDCTYRFYRDTRFSQDKSPYKNHTTKALKMRALVIVYSNCSKLLIINHLPTQNLLSDAECKNCKYKWLIISINAFVLGCLK